jgi:hypothetical protein
MGTWLEFSEQLIRIDIDGHVRFEYECSDESGRQPHSIHKTLEYTVSPAEDGSFVSGWRRADRESKVRSNLYLFPCVAVALTQVIGLDPQTTKLR